MKKSENRGKLSVITTEDEIQERPQITATDPEGETTDTLQYEGAVTKTVTKKYEAQPPKQMGVNPTVAAIVTSLQEKNTELGMQIRENNHAIAILKMTEMLRNGENPHPQSVFMNNNLVIEIPQPPKPVE